MVPASMGQVMGHQAGEHGAADTLSLPPFGGGHAVDANDLTGGQGQAGSDELAPFVAEPDGGDRTVSHWSDDAAAHVEIQGEGLRHQTDGGIHLEIAMRPAERRGRCRWCSSLDRGALPHHGWDARPRAPRRLAWPCSRSCGRRVLQQDDRRQAVDLGQRSRHRSAAQPSGPSRTQPMLRLTDASPVRASHPPSYEPGPRPAEPGRSNRPPAIRWS